jgi:hypothetical protein
VQRSKGRVIMARLLGPGEKDDGSFDREFWGHAGTEAIFRAAAAMVADVASFRGQDESPPRLRRTVVRLVFRAR